MNRTLLAAIALLISISIPLAQSSVAQPQALNPLVRRCFRVTVGSLKSQDANSPINVRRDAGLDSEVQHIGYQGDRLKLLGCTIDADSYAWYKVQFQESGAVGWVRADFIYLDFGE